jgi:hypothetical protein
MVKRQRIIFNCETVQSQMNCIGSPTPLKSTIHYDYHVTFPQTHAQVHRQPKKILIHFHSCINICTSCTSHSKARIYDSEHVYFGETPPNSKKNVLGYSMSLRWQTSSSLGGSPQNSKNNKQGCSPTRCLWTNGEYGYDTFN